MLKTSLLIIAFLPFCLSAFRLNIKNKSDIPHGKELETHYVNGFARKFPQCIVYLAKENRHDQTYRAIKSHLEAIITNGISHHKNNNLTLPQEGHVVDQELDLIIKKINLEIPLQEIEERIGQKLPIHPAYCEVPSVFIQNN